MPKGLVKDKEDEKAWKKAKDIVARKKNKSESSFKDDDWKLVNGMYKRLNKKKDS